MPTRQRRTYWHRRWIGLFALGWVMWACEPPTKPTPEESSTSGPPQTSGPVPPSAPPPAEKEPRSLGIEPSPTPEEWPPPEQQPWIECSPPESPILVAPRFRENAVVALVGGEDLQELATLAARSDLALGDYRLSIVETPSSESPYFYLVATSGPKSVLRVYCKDPVRVVAQKWIHPPGQSPNERDPGLVVDPAATQELPLRALAFRLGDRRIEIWSAEDRGWKTPQRAEGAGLALGLEDRGLRYSYLTWDGQLIVRTPGQSALDFGSELLGRRVERQGQTAIVDRASAIYVLTSSWGAAHELDARETTSLYEFDDGTEFLWWDRFFSPEGGGRIGFFLLSRTADGPLTRYQGEIFIHDNDGSGKVQEKIELTPYLESLGSGEARIYIRPQDSNFGRLSACLIANVGVLDDPDSLKGVVRELELRQHFSSKKWRTDEIRSEELDSIGMEHVKILGSPADKSGIVYNLLTGDPEDSFHCALSARS